MQQAASAQHASGLLRLFESYNAGSLGVRQVRVLFGTASSLRLCRGGEEVAVVLRACAAALATEGDSTSSASAETACSPEKAQPENSSSTKENSANQQAQPQAVDEVAEAVRSAGAAVTQSVQTVEEAFASKKEALERLREALQRAADAAAEVTASHATAMDNLVLDAGRSAMEKQDAVLTQHQLKLKELREKINSGAISASSERGWKAVGVLERQTSNAFSGAVAAIDKSLSTNAGQRLFPFLPNQRRLPCQAFLSRRPSSVLLSAERSFARSGPPSLSGSPSQTTGEFHHAARGDQGSERRSVLKGQARGRAQNRGGLWTALASCAQ